MSELTIHTAKTLVFEGRKMIDFKVGTQEIMPIKGYNMTTALSYASLILEGMTGKDKATPILEICSPKSILKSVYEMVSNGYDPSKNECYFIPMGNEMTCKSSIFGVVKQAIRENVILDGSSYVVRKNDIYKSTQKDGSLYRTVLRHDYDSFSDRGEIIGAYALLSLPNGEIHLEEMSFPDIQVSWSQSKTGGAIHRKFPEEMARKTVMRRALKYHFASSKLTELDAQAEIETGTQEIVLDQMGRYAPMMGIQEEIQEHTVLNQGLRDLGKQLRDGEISVEDFEKARIESLKKTNVALIPQVDKENEARANTATHEIHAA